MVKIYDRQLKTYSYEKQYGEEKLIFLYNNAVGRIFLKLVFVNKFFSKLNAANNSTKRSRKKIPEFVKKYDINMDGFEKEFNSFNDFFRRKKENIKTDAGVDVLISPAQAKLTVYNVDEGSKLKIKGSCYDLIELLKDEKLAKEFNNGICLVFRLSVDNYHRFCYCASGNVKARKRINGKLHTVSSISQRYKIFKENQREYEVVDTDDFGEIIQMEVGAMLVGKIVNSNKTSTLQGEEKGYFEYGGSTIILLLKENCVQIDEDILIQSQNNIETKVNYGEKIGKKK